MQEAQQVEDRNDDRVDILARSLASISCEKRNFNTLWHVPPRFSAFTGRKQQLATLTQSVSINQQHWVISAPKQNANQISGTGGIGKTQIAVEFVHQIISAKTFDVIVWLNADCTIHDQLNIQFLELAADLNIDAHSMSKTQLIKTVYNSLCMKGRVLIIFDSASSYTHVVDYLPSQHLPASTVITTRDDQLWSEHFKPLSIGIFSEEESLEFLSKVLDNPHYDLQDAKRLAEELGHYPLGLAQAAGYIKTTNISIDTYIQLFKQKRSNKKALLDKKPLATDPHMDTIWVTVNMCIEQLIDVLPLKILPIVAYLAPEQPLSTTLFRYWINDQEQCNQAISMLRKTSLFENSNDEQCIRMHQLVQEIIRLNHDQGTTNDLLLVIAKFVEHNFIEEHQPQVTENNRKRLLPHVLQLIHHLQGQSEFQSNQFQGVFGPLAYSAGYCYRILGESKQAAILFEQALTAHQQIGSDIRIASSQQALGCVLGKMGDVEREEELLNLALERRKKIFGSTHSEVATVQINLANCLHARGRDKEALDILLPALTVIERFSSPNDPDLAIALIGLANIYSHNEQFEQALSSLVRARTIIERCYNPEHPQVANVLGNLAEAYEDLGQYDLHAQYAFEALGIFEKAFGKDRPEVAGQLNNCSKIFARDQNFKKQSEYIERALKIMEDHFGLESVQYAGMLHNKAMADLHNGKPFEHVQQLEHVLSLYKKYYGENHTQVAMILNDISHGYFECGEPDKTRESLEEAIRIFTLSRSRRSRNAAMTLGNLANYYGNIGNVDKRIELLKEVYQIFLSIYQEDKNPNIAKTLAHLGDAYGQKGDFIQKKNYLVQALKMKIQLYTEMHFECAITYNSLTDCHEALGELPQALHTAERAYRIALAKIGASHNITEQLRQRWHHLAQVSQQRQVSLLDTSRNVPVNANTALIFAKECLAYEQFQSALHLFNYVLSNQIGSPEILEMVATCHLELGDLASAQACLYDLPRTSLSKRISELEAENEENEATLLSFELAQERLSAEQLIMKADCHFKLKQFQQAVRILDEVLKQIKDDQPRAELLYKIGRCYFYLQDYDLALTCLSKSQGLCANQKTPSLINKIKTVQGFNGKLIAILAHISQEESKGQIPAIH